MGAYYQKALDALRVRVNKELREECEERARHRIQKNLDAGKKILVDLEAQASKEEVSVDDELDLVRRTTP